MKRIRYSSGTIFEANYGYSRAVRIGDRVLVAGTTAAAEHHTGAEGEAAEQTDAILERINGVLAQFGSSLADVVSFHCYVVNVERDSEAVALTLGKYFRDIRPAGTLVGTSALIRPNMLVEIDVEAVLGSGEEIEDL